MLTKTAFGFIAALVIASSSTAFARSDRQNDVVQHSYPYSYSPNEEIRLDHAKGGW